MSRQSARPALRSRIYDFFVKPRYWFTKPIPQMLSDEYRESMRHRLEKGVIEKVDTNRMLTPDLLIYLLNHHNCIGLSMMQTGSGYERTGQYSVDVRAVNPYNNQFPMLVRDLKRWKRNHYTAVLLSGSHTRAKRLAAELQAEELIPFIENFGKTDMVMVAHLTVPNVTDDGLPASLSRELITGKLRGELGYDGLIVTDALAMGAIAAQYSSAEAALLTFTAGSDILLMPHDYREAFEAIADAVRSGTVSEERLNESVLRILRWKERLGLPLTLSADRAG